MAMVKVKRKGQYYQYDIEPAYTDGTKEYWMLAKYDAYDAERLEVVQVARYTTVYNRLLKLTNGEGSDVVFPMTTRASHDYAGAAASVAGGCLGFAVGFLKGLYRIR